MAAETLTFTLDGVTYEVPQITDLDMDEWTVMWEYTGLVLDDFAPHEDEDEEADRKRRLRTPAFTRALLHIGLMRAHPDMKESEITAITGKAKLIRVMEAMGDAVDEEGDVDPPALTSAPEQSLPRSSDGSNENGSAASPPSSETPDDPPVPTTTGELASSSE